MRARRAVVELGALCAVYVAVTVGLTWPLASEIGTHLPVTVGFVGADQYYLGWALAWQTHALTSDPLGFPHANIYWPAPMALFYGTPGFALVPIFAPFFLATGNPTLASNATMIASLALTAATLHWVTRRWTDSHLAGLTSAATFLTSKTGAVMSGFLGQYAALAAIPLIAWLVAEPDFSWRRSAILAGLIVLQSLADVVYLGSPIMLTVGLTASVMLLRPSTRVSGERVLAALALAAVALLPVYLTYLGVKWANPELRQQSAWGSGSTDDVMLALGRWWRPLGGPLAFDAPVLAWIALGALVRVAGVGRVSTRARAWSAATTWFLVGVVVSWLIPRYVPALRAAMLDVGIRAATRLGHGGLIGACLLAGLAFSSWTGVIARCVPRVRPAWTAALLACLYSATCITYVRIRPGDYPLAAVTPRGPAARAALEGEGPVLVLPLGLPSLEHHVHARAMYQSIGNWRPLLNGYSSYYPEGFRDRMSLARRLPDPDALRALRRETGLTTIVVEASRFPGMMFGPWLRGIETGALRGVRIRRHDQDVLVLDIAAEAGGGGT